MGGAVGKVSDGVAEAFTGGEMKGAGLDKMVPNAGRKLSGK